MLIGQLARASGASQKAIRHYEALGLLGPIPRQGAYRRYSDEVLRQVLLIRQAQGLGFRLAELQRLLANGEQEPDWAAVRALASGKQAAIRAEIARLNDQHSQLDAIQRQIDLCLAAPETAPCSRDLNPLSSEA